MSVAPKSNSSSEETKKLSPEALAKDLVGTAILTFLILTPIVALRTQIGQGVITIVQKWGMVFALTAIVVGVRLALHLFVWNRTSSSSTKATPAVSGISLSDQIGPCVAPALLCFALAFPLFTFFHPIWDKRVMDLAVYILIYIMLGWGLNVVVGLAGLLDLGYVAFDAVGAYAYALLTTVYFPQWFGTGILPWAFYISLPVAGLLAATWRGEGVGD